jgi:hypothetical protein
MNVQRHTFVHKSVIEERLSTGNVTLIRDRVIIVTVEKQYVLHIPSVFVLKRFIAKRVCAACLRTSYNLNKYLPNVTSEYK